MIGMTKCFELVLFLSLKHCTSQLSHVEYCVPRGSVLGPLLFTLYTAPIEEIVHYHGLDCMIYADDCQLYIIMNRGDRFPLTKLCSCINDILPWNMLNKLQCNPEKTEIIHFSSRFLHNNGSWICCHCAV